MWKLPCSLFCISSFLFFPFPFFFFCFSSTFSADFSYRLLLWRHQSRNGPPGNLWPWFRSKVPTIYTPWPWHWVDVPSNYSSINLRSGSLLDRSSHFLQWDATFSENLRPQETRRENASMIWSRRRKRNRRKGTRRMRGKRRGRGE